MLTSIQLACQTQFTKTGVLDTRNRKPYRTKVQKAVARRTAQKTAKGYYVSSAPVSYHK